MGASYSKVPPEAPSGGPRRAADASAPDWSRECPCRPSRVRWHHFQTPFRPGVIPFDAGSRHSPSHLVPGQPGGVLSATRWNANVLSPEKPHTPSERAAANPVPGPLGVVPAAEPPDAAVTHKRLPDATVGSPDLAGVIGHPLQGRDIGPRPTPGRSRVACAARADTAERRRSRRMRFS